VVARIDALLPQTQCTRCGYAGCKPYAAAIASGEAGINQCPPGGSATIAALAALTGRPVQALYPVYGAETPPRVAWIDESRCIGCARCLAPCPVDCIEMRPQPKPVANQAALNRLRFEAHAARLLNQAAERQRELDLKKAAAAHRAAEP
jgi:Na+-translocating ferredoxin:NAD+ oxidoreductase RNF subunit RnfB